MPLARRSVDKYFDLPAEMFCFVLFSFFVGVMFWRLFVIININELRTLCQVSVLDRICRQEPVAPLFFCCALFLRSHQKVLVRPCVSIVSIAIFGVWKGILIISLHYCCCHCTLSSQHSFSTQACIAHSHPFLTKLSFCFA